MSSESKPMKKRDPRSKDLVFLERDNLPDIDKDPDFVYRGFNNEPGRIRQKLKEGWVLVDAPEEDDLGKEFDDPGKLGSYAWYQANKKIGDTKGIMMRMPKKLYQEREAHKQKLVDDRDRSIHPNRYTEENQFVHSVKRSYGGYST